MVLPKTRAALVWKSPWRESGHGRTKGAGGAGEKSFSTALATRASISCRGVFMRNGNFTQKERRLSLEMTWSVLRRIQRAWLNLLGHMPRSWLRLVFPGTGG